jgi:hypothetical protein
LNPGLTIAGCILNRTGSREHAHMILSSLRPDLRKLVPRPPADPSTPSAASNPQVAQHFLAAAIAAGRKTTPNTEEKCVSSDPDAP